MSNYIEHKEHQKLSWKLPAGVILFILVILTGFVVSEAPENPYKVSVAEMQKQLLQPEENIINLKRVASIIKTEDKKYRFVDIRTPHEFLKGHIPGAVNIPIHQLLDEEHVNTLNPTDGTINILYYDKHSGACAPWMLLYQMGYKNNRIMVGGYQVVKDNILDKYNIQAVNPKDEVAKYDYADIVAKTAGAGTAKKAAQKAAPIIKKRKKKGAVEGGC